MAPKRRNGCRTPNTTTNKLRDSAQKYLSIEDPTVYTRAELMKIVKEIPKFGDAAIYDIENRESIIRNIKHELTHNYGVSDNESGVVTESIMDYTSPGGVGPMDWSIEEMDIIKEKMGNYQDREIEEVTNIEENLTFYKTGNLFFTKTNGSPLDTIGAYEEGMDFTAIDTDIKLGIDYYAEEPVQDVSDRFNLSAVVGNELTFTPIIR